jgi:NitT/TauT family transport system substrate-binding protein
MGRFARLAFALSAFFAASTAAPRAEPIKIGVIKNFGAAPLYIAEDKGYFAAQGVPAELVWFDAAQPITVGVVSGALDFGVTGLTAALYNLAWNGQLKLISGFTHEAPGFHDYAYVVSNQAYGAGFTALKDFPGHSIATTQIGSSSHYALALLSEKFGFDPKSFRMMPMQSIANMRSALTGGQVDAAITVGSSAMPLVQEGKLKLLGWVGDETPWQVGAAFTATRTANERRTTVEAFLRAFREATRDYHDAFADSADIRRDGPAAPEILTLIAKYTGVPVEQILPAIPFIDANGRLDEKDVLHQIAWYKSQGMVNGEVVGATIFDGRYVLPTSSP